MKRNLIALTAMLACTVASAQSNVTLFGIVDTAWERVNNSGASSVSHMVAGAMNSSRLGFRGVEDLGGGLSASFWLEAGLANDSGAGLATNTNNQATGSAGGGALTFGRRATVGLSGPSWGELRAGRDYVPGMWNVLIEDPFNNVGVGASQSFNGSIVGVTQIRASNMVNYLTPTKLGGFFANLAFWLGENPSGTATEDDGRGGGARVGYASGPFEGSIAFSRTSYAAGDVRQSNVGASWNFAVAKVMGSFSRDRNGAVEARGGVIGFVAPVGSGGIKASYSWYDIEAPGVASRDASKMALGYVYHFSKRTDVYATAARVRNSGAATFSAASGAGAPLAGRSSSGYDLGIRHAF